VRRRPAIAVASVVAMLLGALWYASDAERLLAVAVARERGAANLEARTTRLQEHDIVFVEGGVSEGPPILLLHGFAADKDNWTRFGKHLEAAGYRIVAPDLPGHGESSRLEKHSYDIPNQVEFVAAFLDDRGIESAHLVGNSMGGHIAGAFAALYPDRVRSLGLFAPAGVTAPSLSERLRIHEQTGTNPLLVETVEDFDRLLEFVFVDPPDMPGVVKQYFADRAVRNRAFNDKIYGDIQSEGRRLPLEPLLPLVEAPALVLWGDSDRVLHPSGMSVFEEGLRDVEAVLQKDMGHSPMLERPGETAGVYVDFLARRVEGR